MPPLNTITTIIGRARARRGAPGTRVHAAMLPWGVPLIDSPGERDKYFGSTPDHLL